MSLDFSFDSIENVHENIQANSPEPNLEALAQQQLHEASSVATPDNVLPPEGNTVDKEGTVFDPAIHATNKDGEPSLTSRGKFRRKKGVTASVVAARSTQNSEAEAKRNQARAAGHLAADMSVNMSIMIMGAEWKPKGSTAYNTQAEADYDEHAMMRKAFADYFEAKDISDFPPGIALTVACMSYAMPRIATGKETQSKIGRAKYWLGEKFKTMRKRNNAAQSDSRDNGKRKDNASEKAVPVEPTKEARNARA